MLVVCALALVVAAAVFLVIGLAGGDVGDLYLSMVLCVASLVVVAVSARLSRARPAAAGSEPPEPVVPVGAAEAEDDPEPADVDVPPRERGGEQVSDPAAGLGDRLAKVPAGVGAGTGDDGSIWAAAPAPASDARPEADPEPEPQVEAQPAAVDLTTGDGVAFPIADYDDLAVAQILPLVPKLWPEEVPVVAARERATKARPAVLDALAETAGDPALAFPIADYERLEPEQITGLLDQLDPADLVTVQAAERNGPARAGVLVAVADRLATRS